MIDTYKIRLPELTADEEKFFRAVKEAISQPLSDSDLQKVFLIDEKKGNFITEVRTLVEDLGIVIMPYERDLVRKKVEKFVQKHLKRTPNKDALVDLLIDYLFSFGVITPLLEDPKIEEIMVNGVGTPVYIAHRERGICKTNVVIEDLYELEWLIKQIMKAGKISKQGKPIYDGSLEDGTRFNMILPPASRYPAITMRKFTPQPFSILELVKKGTMDLNIAAFLWLATEGMGVRPANILVVGGASSGKTTTLNALLGFVPQGSRLITIEDTPELNLGPRENWVPLYTHYDFKKNVEITLDDLVRASLRMRPDRIVVGEVRGKEAEGLFIAMDVGCAGSMGTLHANSAKEAISRLTSPPMNVPETLIPLVDLIIVQQRMNIPGKGIIRRVTEIVEVDYLDRVNLGTIFRWSPETDTFVETDIPPRYLDHLSNVTGRTKREIMDELERRKTILENAMNSHKIEYKTLYPMLERRLSSY